MTSPHMITVSRCDDGHRTHPVRRDCPACGADMHPVVIEGKGTVITWTRIERPPEGFKTPQLVVLVRLEAEREEKDPPVVLAAVADTTTKVECGNVMLIRDTQERYEAEPL
ncbi:MAG: hypothetical protein KY455_02465 [Euryarchaeota archaeon]|nr:hypothetical protein [Euryarchaeota archaeon]